MAIKFLNSVAVDTDVLFVDTANERVGIGTDNPLFKLQVQGSVALDVMPTNESEGIVRIGRYDSNTSRYNDIKSYVSSTAASNYLKFSVHGGVENATVDVMTLNGSGNATFTGNVGIGTTSPSAALEVVGGIKLSDNSPLTWATSNTRIFGQSGYMQLQVASTDVMRLASSGNVGIGTTAPGAKLDVRNGDINISTTLPLIGSAYNKLNFYSATAGSGVGASIGAYRGNNYVSGGLVFETGELTTSERMRITPTGNVGIGTTSPSQELHVDGNARVTGAYYDSGNTPGTANQLLASTATGTAWIDPSTITAEAATLVVIACKNTSGATIAQGTPVYQTGTVGATATIEIAPADALISANKLPAIGLLQTDLNNNGFGNVVITGELTNFTTDPIDGLTPTAGDKVFVKSGGGLTLTKPTGEGNGIQNMGLVGKVSGGNSGSITVSSIMRTNDVPNLPEGRIWVGDGNTIVSDTVYIDEPNNRLGIGTTSPGQKLDVSGNIASNSIYLYDSTSNDRLVLDLDASDNLQIATGTSTGSRGITFFTENSEKMRITSTGNVGIGTTSPSSKLTIGGNVITTKKPTVVIADGVAGASLVLRGLSPILSFDRTGAAPENKILMDGAGLEFKTGTLDAEGDVDFKIKLDGKLQAPAYTQGFLQSDASGNIEISGGGTLPGGPYLPLAGGTMTGATLHGDSVHSYWGASNDLQIDHDGNHSVINNLTGHIYISNESDDGDIVFRSDDGSGGTATYMYLDGGGGLTRLSRRLRADDGVKIEAGSTGDLQIYHDGSNSYISDTGTGDLIITADNDLTFKDGSGNIMANMNASNSVELMFGNSKKFETTSAGVTVTGDTTADQFISNNNGNGQNYKIGDDVWIGDINVANTFRVQGASNPNNGYITFGNASNTQLGRAASGPLTWGGAFEATTSVTSPTFLGDLNGTINTVTTAVTKANATNDTTVATTAFVQNLIGTIPAGLVFQGTWDAATNTPTLTSGSGTTGHFYIVSTSGSTNLDGVTDWVTGDWAVFIEQGATDAWEKIDNSSVLDGAGTGQTVALWSGSGTSNTLDDSILTQSGGSIITQTATGVAQYSLDSIAANDSVVNFKQAGVQRAKIGYDNSEGALAFVRGTGSFATAGMVLDATGVGIGTTSPLTKLHIAGTTDANIIRVENTSTALSVGDTIGAIQFFNNDTTDDSPNVAASIYATAGASGGSGSLRFKTIEPGVEGDPATEAMIITNGGNVGIGTTSPSRPLSVQSSATSIIADFKYALAAYSSIDLSNTVGTARISSVNNDLVLSPGTTERMRILSGGNVGIGTTSPGAKLDVTGEIRASEGSDYTAISTSGGDTIFNNASSGANNIRIFNGGSERMRITSAGDTGIGVTTPRAKLDVAGGIKVADDTDTAGANKVGTLRYRTSGNNSYVDMCMQTGASTYEWINVVQNNW